MSPTWSQSTVAKVAEMIRGQINADPDAPGGTVPDRLSIVVRAAGIRVWNMADWDFRGRAGTLTVADTDTSVEVPDDFGKLDSKWLRDNSDKMALQFFSDARLYQTRADGYATDDTGMPEIAIVQTRTVADDYQMEFVFKPTSDGAYTFPYRYMARDPWSVPDDLLTDDESPQWPADFDLGWELLATAMAYYKFAPGAETADKVGRAFKRWGTDALANLNETITGGKSEDLIEDGYDDYSHFMSNALWTDIGSMAKTGIAG